jgi:hypothetical protein
MANPLQQYFRQASVYLKLPTLGRWYKNGEVSFSESQEIAIFGMTAIDDILISTPDAMLSGAALEKIIQNCAPDVKNVKKLMSPDLEAIFLGIKIGTTGGKYDVDRVCPKCSNQMTFEVNCEYLMSTMTYVEDSDTVLNINNELEIRIKPYNLEMRRMFITKQFEEDRLLKSIDANNKELDEFQKADILQKSIEKISRITFNLVSQSIESVRLIKQGLNVNDAANISEWLVNIPKSQADIVINAVNKLNEIGINKKVQARCEKCGHEWEDELSLDPTSFFSRPSRA